MVWSLDGEKNLRIVIDTVKYTNLTDSVTDRRSDIAHGAE